MLGPAVVCGWWRRMGGMAWAGALGVMGENERIRVGVAGVMGEDERIRVSVAAVMGDIG
jgi:hypothetical protein